MANGNGNGNGNDRIGIVGIAHLASTGVLLLGMFGLWWQSADPRARLDKIEATQLDNRKELNEVITGLRRELSTNYVSLREHNDIQKEIDSKLSRVQFEAWKEERDRTVEKLLVSIIKQIDQNRADIEIMKAHAITRDEHNLVLKAIDENKVAIDRAVATLITRPEYEQKWLNEGKIDEDVKHRIEIVSAEIQKLKDVFSTSAIEEIQRRLNLISERLYSSGAGAVDHRVTIQGK